MRPNHIPLTEKEKERYVELLTKMTKLQRLMRIATPEQQNLIFARASEVIGELVRDFDGDEVWCNALLTFGGQYFGQLTEKFIGEEMSDEQISLCLKREVERDEERRK